MKPVLANQDIRKAAKSANVRLWEIALRLGKSELTISRNLRTELSEAEKASYFNLIREIEAERITSENGVTHNERKI